MSENKQYASQHQDTGAILISEDVFSTIVERAVTDVEGVAGISNMPGSDITEFISKNWGRGMKIQISEENSVSIGCNIVICYGYSVVDIAAAVQASVINAVESMTGAKVLSVNVNVPVAVGVSPFTALPNVIDPLAFFPPLYALF